MDYPTPSEHFDPNARGMTRRERRRWKLAERRKALPPRERRQLEQSLPARVKVGLKAVIRKHTADGRMSTSRHEARQPETELLARQRREEVANG